ncbi:MAG: LPS export ABC transporter periplasmic protein LptC [Desulfofustis sp. PB-SRB1]|nr:LPS export ABC transporter periplasmic protein LptC [Desulfofustis sp. PB-SRB1]MBM1001647.1 LPS export ABC transporter periplasmic protein LptC [Desulfofustis sp. PB-SRB1]
MLMNARRNLLWLAPLVMIVTFPLWRPPVASFLAPRGDFDSGPSSAPAATQEFVMDNVHIMQNKADKKTGVIRAKTAQTGNTPNDFILRSVDGEIYSEQGDIITVVADIGHYDMVSRTLTLEDNVVVNRQSEQQTLYSDKLFYFDETQRIESPGPARLVGEYIEIDGASLDYDIATAQYKVGGRLRCVIMDFDES